MSIIFFNAPVGTPKVQFVNSDRSVAYLKKIDVIPEGATTLTMVEPSTDEGMAKLAHVDKLTFDNMENPKEVIWDMDLVDAWWKEVYRDCRKEILADLDLLQQRALVRNLTDVVAEIEDDKQKLRDLPSTVDYTQCTSFVQTCLHDPIELFTDYEEKYREALQ